MSLDQMSEEMEQFFEMRAHIMNEWTPEEFAQHRVNATDRTMQLIHDMYLSTRSWSFRKAVESYMNLFGYRSQDESLSSYKMN